jgi:hypothetical protein
MGLNGTRVSSRMLNSLPAAVLLDIAILATALSWSIGFYAADRRFHLFASLAIGCFVVLCGFTVGSLGSPAWVVFLAPLPLDFLLLWYVMRVPRKMAISYVTAWVVYVALHVVLSVSVHYDSLIPPWRLHA